MVPNSARVVVWTEKALHINSSSSVKVTYTNTQLYVTLKGEHPALCDGTLINEDTCSTLLMWFDGKFWPIYNAHNKIKDEHGSNSIQNWLNSSTLDDWSTVAIQLPSHYWQKLCCLMR